MSLHELGVVDAAQAIRRKEISPVDLVEALLGRVDAVDGRIQAWALVDRDGARATAVASYFGMKPAITFEPASVRSPAL